MGKVMIIGSGGREHALGWNIAKDDNVSEVLFAPGNAGTEEGKCRNVAIDGAKKENFLALFELITREQVDMVVVGPEAPLAEGLTNFLYGGGFINVFGPIQEASCLESDKFFSYELMRRVAIPQADSAKCFSTEEAIQAINERTTERGIVIKARGLTGGKGVSVCDTKEEALRELTQHAQLYGPEVLIAERLVGQEFSVFGISDGKRVLPLEISVQDHKRRDDNDRGPNTGGMGAYGPAPVASAQVVKQIADRMMTPAVKEIARIGCSYRGFLYAGMIMTETGPKVLEFNIRMGDPECQPAVMMLRDSLYEPLSLALEGRLDDVHIEFNPGASCCVVLASNGYPGDYKKGLKIEGLEEAGKLDNVKVFHAGTKQDNGQILTSGGRVLGVTGYSPNGIADAQKLAYEAVSKINIPGGFHYRKDIADKALGR